MAMDRWFPSEGPRVPRDVKSGFGGSSNGYAVYTRKNKTHRDTAMIHSPQPFAKGKRAMLRGFFTGLFALTLGLTAGQVVASDTGNPALWKHHVAGNFEEVLDSIRHGLETEQFTISDEQDLSGALERNKETLGEDRWNTIGFDQVRAVHFCSLLFNQRAFNTNIDLSILCPFKLVAYTMKAAPREVTVITVRPSYLVQHDPEARSRELGQQMEERIIRAIKTGLDPF